jgi:glycosyltransferase involved in cell wall biosynthesis
VDRLISAAATLNREGIPIHVAVVGEGPMRKEWERLATHLGIEERVRFVGLVPASDVPGYIAGFDAGFSGQQGMKMGAMYHSPLKLYEYLAMGKPIVASAFDDARKLTEGTGAGFLFAPGDTDDLERVLVEAYSARHSAGEVGARAREEILREHSWRARIEAMIPAVEEILARAR